MDALKAGARRRREAGAEIIEFALVLPLLLFVMIGIFDFGLMFRDYGVITNAAREGARIGVLAGYSDDDVRARAASYMTTAGLTPDPGDTYVDPIDLVVGGRTVHWVRVTVFYHHTFSFLAPIATLVGQSFGSITLRAVSTMRVEGPA